jgi:hypothetical protein
MAVASTSVQPQQASQPSILAAQHVDLREQLVMCAARVRFHSIIVAADANRPQHASERPTTR